MRLVCPSCAAQYEIDQALLPAEGRDVQCSACGHVWFQGPSAARPAAERAASGLADEAPTEEPVATAHESAPAPPRREIDPSVLEVLRDEAAFEARQRQREVADLDSQQELGLDAPPEAPTRPQAPSPSVQRARTDRPKDHPSAPHDHADKSPMPERAAQNGPRSGLLPDIESISSTLNPGSASGDAARGGANADDGGTRSGFVRGFALVIAVVILALALYIAARPIAQAVPGLEPALLGYEATIDRALRWTSELVTGG